MEYKELAWNCEVRAEVFRTLRNEAGAMHEEQCSRAITDLLARAEAAEAMAEKAEKKLEAAVSDLETIMAYNSDTCQFCKNGKCYVRGGTKPCLPKWRGQKEE